jgi:hypothetical protein
MGHAPVLHEQLHEREIPAEIAAALADASVRTIERWCQHIPGLGRPYRPPHGRGKAHWAVNLDKLRPIIEMRKRSTAPDVLPRGTVRKPAPRARLAGEGTFHADPTVVCCHVCTQPLDHLPPRPVGPGLTYDEAVTELGLSHETIVTWANRIPSLKVAIPGSRRPRLDPLFLAAVDAYRADGKLPVGSLSPRRKEFLSLCAAIIRFCKGYFLTGMVGNDLPKWPHSLAEIWRSQFYRERYRTPPVRAAGAQSSEAEVYHGTR